MVLLYNTNNMKINYKEHDIHYNRKAVFSIAIGTVAGLLTYGFFLYYHIDIYGWNLGLIFAPLAAGYVETLIANRLLGENVGAISAFILFIDTVIYGFILKNPTLGFNFITAGSIIVILQAAFPTLINFILLVGVGGLLSGFAKQIREFERKIVNRIKNQNTIAWETPYEEKVPIFNENESNMRLNSLDFYFLTSTDMISKPHKIIGHFQSEVIVEKNTHLIHIDPEKIEQQHLNTLKQGKDDCLIKLANQIKSQSGNGVLDLTINYSLIGLGGDCFHIIATGMGIYIE